MSVNDVFKLIRNPDSNWGTSYLDPDALRERVLCVCFWAHTNSSNLGADGQAPTNHWSLFLPLSTTKSVHIDMVPSEPDKPGMIMIESKAYTVSDNNVFLLQSPVPEGTTVAQILSIIIGLGRDRYTPAAVGEGCRYWLSVIAGDMYEAGILPKEIVDQARWALGQFWRHPKGTGYVERAMAEGDFY
jgi:hypothetical protein